MSRTTTEFDNSDLEAQPEQVSSGSLIFLLDVGEIAQLQCKLYSEPPSLFLPVPQLERRRYESPKQKTNIYAPFSCCFFERVGCRPDLVVGTAAEPNEMAWRLTGARRLISFKVAKYQSEQALWMLNVTWWLNTKK